VVTAGPRRFTIDEYARTAEIGIFGAEARVELVAGAIVDLAAKGDAHVRRLMRCLRAFTPHVTDDPWLAVQDPVRLGRYSQPEPDLLVCRVGPGTAPGIPDAWLLDLVDRRIERYTEPSAAGYRLIAVANGGESLPSTILPGLILATDALLG